MSEILKKQFPPRLNDIYTEELANQLAQTQGAIASLNQLSRFLPNPRLLMRPILIKEAESSAQLEGTQASMIDAYEIDIIDQTEETKNEALEIRNYEQAMLTGVEIVEKFDLNLFTLREMHKTLMNGVRGKNKHPGEFRKGDVWIGADGTGKGEARYIPPDAVHVVELMKNLEEYIQLDESNPLIMCAVMHHRFEAIHPFEDGNGRTGRLLISLFLIKRGLLSMPILYPSGFFEMNKHEYLDCLSQVDTKDNWYRWIMFFLKGLQTQAELSHALGIEIDELFKQSKKSIENETASLNLIRVLEYSFSQPYITAPNLSRDTGIPRVSCRRYLETLKDKKIIKDLGLHKKQNVYVNNGLINILKKI